MSNDFYNHGSYPAQGASGASANMRAELDSIAAGFDKLPTLAGNGTLTVQVNSGGTALVANTDSQARSNLDVYSTSEASALNIQMALALG